MLFNSINRIRSFDKPPHPLSNLNMKPFKSLLLLSTVSLGVLTLALLAISGCSGESNTKQPVIDSTKAVASTNLEVSELTDSIISIIESGEHERLAGLVHPDRGVRFSPYVFVKKNIDLVLFKSDIQNLSSSDSILEWGVYDGSGEPMLLSLSKFLKQYASIGDCLDTVQISTDELLQRGNMVDNHQDVYPNSVVVEVYCSGYDSKYEGMDWEACRFVFEEKNSRYFLIGIVHNGWTI